MSEYSKESMISFHTFMIGRAIRHDMWAKLKNKIYEEAKTTKDKTLMEKEEHENYHILTYKKFKNIGIIIRLQWHDCFAGTQNHRIEITVNPRRLIGDDTYVGIFEITQENLKCLDNRLICIIESLGFYHNEGISSFHLSRIDLCANLYLKDTNTYVNLVRRCIWPRGYEKYEHKNKKIPIDGVYLMGKHNHSNIQVYNKYKEMLKGGYEKRPEELERARDLLRIEVQLRRLPIQLMEKANHIPPIRNGMSGVLVAFGMLSPIILIEKIRKVFGNGSYYRFNQCLKLVEKSTLKNKTKDILKRYFYCTMNYQDAHKAAKLITYHHDAFHIPEVTKPLKKISINPVPMYEKSYKYESDYDVLPSLYHVMIYVSELKSDYYTNVKKLNQSLNPNLFS